MKAPGPLTCREVLERLALYLDRELTPDEISQVDEHLAMCEVCTRERHFEAAVLEDLKHKLRRIAAPPDLLDRIKATLEQVEPAGD